MARETLTGNGFCLCRAGAALAGSPLGNVGASGLFQAALRCGSGSAKLGDAVRRVAAVKFFPKFCHERRRAEEPRKLACVVAVREWRKNERRRELVSMAT